MHIVLCKTALGSDRKSGDIGSSNRKEKETIFVYINYMYNRCTVPVCTKRNSAVISLGLKLATSE